MYIYLCFDVEDLVHPDSDDIPRDLATMLADDGVVASMYVVGEKARLWERRGRWDVIAAVAQHDVGLHTDHHSVIRPCPNWPPHRPDLRLDLLAQHTRLQSWSLAPARLA